MSLLKKNVKALDQSIEKILQTDFAENNKVKLKLNGHKFVFDDGEWKNENLENVDISAVLKRNKKLKEENNFLKLKVEVLLLMLAENIAKSEEETVH